MDRPDAAEPATPGAETGDIVKCWLCGKFTYGGYCKNCDVYTIPAPYNGRLAQIYYEDFDEGGVT